MTVTHISTPKISDLNYKIIQEGATEPLKDEQGKVRTGEIYQIILMVNKEQYALKLALPLGVKASRERVTAVVAALAHALEIVGFVPVVPPKLDG